uniref:Calponin-homology (CH) domain-containing protein n=1 Tax=Electrophorus electricus TaxID=8005 RepID=A0A4W4HBU8_ELEEL
MDITVSELMSNFMESPLVVWVKTLGPLASNSDDKLSMFMELVDGVFLHKIMTHIDPSPMNHRLNKQVNNDVSLRIQNLSTVIRHIKSYYQVTSLQHFLLQQPITPWSRKSMEEMKKLLLLLLGCAVQCDRKEEIIEKIKLLDIETQAAIVSHIQEVTDSQENVLDLQWLEEGKMCVEELDSLSRTMAFHLRKLIDERDECSELVLELTQEKDYLQSQQSLAPVGFSSPERPLQLSKDDRQHLAVELADTKGKLRRSRQELEEKTEQLMDTKNELDRLDAEMQKQKQENLQLLSEARSVRAYRDEVDALRERAGRVDRLETELARFKERLHDVHFYKARVEELREDNVTLLETKTLLEEQLSTARGRCDKLHELEKENLHLRSKLHDMEIDRDSDKKRLEELLEENMLLEISQKQSMNESAHLGWELEQLTKNNEVNEACKSFVFELNETASSRLLKLEKENQSLQSTIQELREASRSLEEGHVHAVELERENRTLKKKVEGLQTQMDQEKQITHDLENQGEELKLQKQKLEKELESLQADRDKQISELQQEKQHLSQTVSSLRMRAQADSEARVRDMEAENRVLHQTISETGVRLARLEADKRQAAKELDGARERAEGAAELEREVARLERGREQLQRELAALAIAGERAEELARENATLEQDNRRLRKQADAAQGISARLATLEADRRQLEEQNLEQRRALEVARPAAARLAQLQHEHSELEGEHAELRAATEELRAHTKRLELGQAALEREKEHLRSSLDASGAEAQGARAELREAETRAEVFRREAEELRRAAERVDEAERARLSAEQELAQAEKERRQLEKEARRLRQQMEAKEAALEESSVKVASMEKESTATGRELARLREASTRVKEQEKENKELQKQATIDKRTLATLREELVNEKLRVQQQHNELEMLSAELEKIGLSREKLLQEEHSTEDSKYKILETKIESTLKKTLELKEEKVQGLESRLEESSSLNQQLRTELAAVKKTLEALRQRQEEEAAHSEMSQKAVRQDLGREKWELEQREATAELLKHKDHLITVEKSNAALETEKHLLKAQLKQLDSQNAQLNAQTLSLQKQVSALQEHNSALHKETAKLQVENSTLSSQSLSLATQYGALQAQLQAMEAEAESLRRERVEARSTRDAAAQDHEHLLAVHERQAAEYEQLITQHATLKASQRTLEQEYRGLQSKYTLLLKQKDAMEELEVSLQRERDSLGEELQKNAMVLGENRSLREEMDRLVQTHTQLRREYDGLQLQSKELKTSLNESQLELNRWQARYDQLKEQHQGLDISMTKLDNHCELLTRLKGNLEEENHHLLSQIQMLSQQNQTLLERTMESKELYHEEQKQYIDKLNSLRRQKEKLEEKIMDQYKFYEPSPKKRSHWVGAKAIAKLIKPKKEALRERPDGSRERLRSAPDIPLPDIPVSPHCLDGSPPLHPPPLPPRQGHLSLDRLMPFCRRNFTEMFPFLCLPCPLDSLERLQRRSASLSSDDAAGMGPDGCRLSQSSLLPRSSTLPCDAPPIPRSAPRSARHRGSSPGSEMVTLEEFLQESNALSPPSVRRDTCREDLMSDYFTRTGRPAPLRDGAKTPTSYVTPTVKTPPSGPDGRASKPGHSVKPSMRLVETSTPPSQSQTLPNRGASGPGGRPSPLQQAGPRGVGGAAGLSRTFSLASADLLHSTGPESYRPEAGSPSQAEGVVRRQGLPARERPHSARLAGTSPPPAVDPRRLSVAPPRDELSLHSSAPLQVDKGPGGGCTGAPGLGRPAAQHHRGEVAMVTPVRAVSALKLEEVEEPGEHRQADLQPLKKADSPGCGTREQPSSSPASPDHTNDPQTVWYEYGCV